MTKLDTGLLTTAASKVRQANTDISGAFETPVRAATQMDRAWSGAASQNAIAAFNSIKSRFPAARSNALESVARVLTAIANGYELTENKNESIADRFK